MNGGAGRRERAGQYVALGSSFAAGIRDGRIRP